MKRKALLFIVLIITVFLLPLTAGDPDLSYFGKGVAAALEGKGEHALSVTGSEERFDENSGLVLLSVFFEFDGKALSAVSSGKNLQEAEKNLERAVFDALKYTPYPEEGFFLLDYDFRSSWSSLSSEPQNGGTLFLLKGADDRNYGLLRANGKGNAEAVEFEPLWDGNIRPGLRLEKTGSGFLSLSFSLSPVQPLTFGFVLDYSLSRLLYPISPVFSLEADAAGDVSVLLGAGGRYYLPLSTVFASDIMFLRSAGLELSLSLTGGFTTDSRILLGSRAEVCYRLFLSHNVYMGAGFSYGATLDCKNDFALHSKSGKICIKGGVRL
jgi:hypothetical protein